MKLLALVLALAVGLAPLTRAHAQDAADTPPDLPPGDDTIEAVSQGEAAPFQGMLLNTDTAIRWTNRLLWYRQALRLRSEHFDDAVVMIQGSHARELGLIEGSYGREIEGLRQDLRDQAAAFAQSQDPAFYETWGFALALGVVLAGTLVGFSAWALSSAN